LSRYSNQSVDKIMHVETKVPENFKVQ